MHISICVYIHIYIGIDQWQRPSGMLNMFFLFLFSFSKGSCAFRCYNSPSYTWICIDLNTDIHIYICVYVCIYISSLMVRAWQLSFFFLSSSKGSCAYQCYNSPSYISIYIDLNTELHIYICVYVCIYISSLMVRAWQLFLFLFEFLEGLVRLSVLRQAKPYNICRNK